MPTLEFKGKQFVYSHHLGVPFRELQVAPAKSLPAKGKKPSLDDNLIIHGDNLEALKALLPTHANKVDCIFIDPPYNTGEEGWCYNDNVRSPLMKEWLKNSANPVDKEDLERHDKWLCMIWPRLHLLHDLLSPSGLIWITLDDNEQHRFRSIMDEIFGEENFLACIAWRKRYTRSNNAKRFYSQKDYVIVYRKSDATDIVKEPRTPKSDSSYTNSDNDPRGPWTTSSYVNPATKAQRKNLVYPIFNPHSKKYIEHPTHAWKFKKEEHEKHVKENRLWWGEDGDAHYPRLKLYLDEAEQLVPVDYWSYREAGSSDDGGQSVKEMFGAAVFDNPKPVKLIRKILDIINNREALILDSFAGSGTTGHAVLEANYEDGGNRRFILVQLDEDVPEDQPAFGLGYRKVIEITADRIRRAITGYEFTGVQRHELYRKNITWNTFQNRREEILKHIDSIENLHSYEYDKINKKIKEGVLTVTGEREVTKSAPGLGGSFTYCNLGDPIDIESLLTGSGLPRFDALARYVFYTVTGQSLEKIGKPSPDGFIGETELFRVHLFYQPEKKWLRSNDAALNAERVAAIEQGNQNGKRAIVFAVAKFMSQKELTARRIEFCQLPYAIHRILGN